MVNSVLIKNIKTLQATLKENISYTDVNFRGIIDDTIEVKNESCLIDVFRIWLMSASNDYHRQPGAGGFLETVVKKPFCDDSCAVIEAALKSETEKKFPNIKIKRIDVRANKATHQWEIQVAIMDEATGLKDETMYLRGEAIKIDAQD